MEFQIPLPPLPSDPTKPDLSIAQRAWWDVINLVYREAKEGRSPMRLTLEMRIMGGSGMLMAPQKGNDLGTASIEVLTIPNADPDQWETFKQEVADIWMGYEVDGAKLNARPHWAKEWYDHGCVFPTHEAYINAINRMGLQKDGAPIQQHLKHSAYKDQIPAFKAELAELGKAQGWDLGDLQKRFSNELWDDIIFS